MENSDKFLLTRAFWSFYLLPKFVRIEVGPVGIVGLEPSIPYDVIHALELCRSIMYGKLE